MEQRVKKTEILKDYLLFLQNELSSKNEIIKSLMDTQSVALKLVTSHTPNDGLHAKNSYNYRQENQKIIEEPEIVPKKFCTEEIQSKQKTNQHKLKLKTIYVGNLDENISEEDLHELFGLKSRKYLQETCKVEVIRDKRNGVSKFTYVTASDHMFKELLKLNDETFKERPLTIEEAKKLPNSPVHSPTKTRSSVVINCHPENQTTFQNKCTSQNNLPIVPGKQTCKNAAVQKRKLPAKTLILSDSIARGIKIYEFNKYIKYDRANLLTFPGATSRHLLHYLDIHLEDRNTETVIIHVGVNDIINENSQSNIEKYISNVEKMVQKCRNYGVKKIFISGLVFSTKVLYRC